MAKTKKDPNAMSFLDHLEELRWHLLRATIAILVGAVVAFIWTDILFDVILFGPKSPDFITYQGICWLSTQLGGDTFCFTEMPFEIINTDMAGQFSMHMWASIVAGIIIAFPYIIWEMWRFIKPGLHSNEKKNGGSTILITALLFLLGVGFGYYVISPLSVQFFGTYTVSSDVENTIRLGSYVSLVTTITLATGLLFELPVIVYFLSSLGILTPDWMRKYRRHAIVVVLVFAAVITPPDPMSQVLVAIPIMILYQISISVSSRVLRRRNAKTA
ncbi:twin-arginine translocase subunit TatC [Phaeocystidibacter luteus]|uniref:Sec-independent protein translocase protein TatC n=1 Tax=Phaeocystidibacter luteus TaxID=911197 RepID=A0A6N6RFK9_9FLAO|nr:twin-arginine translocase subunit TatC [Phaeocystidibacter luteus]KAB2807325.1 twin-arginine translocase subunit TatC [Phaeocystidibacter luteus]